MLIFLHENVTNEHHNLRNATDFRINFAGIILYNILLPVCPENVRFRILPDSLFTLPRASKSALQNTVARELSPLHLTVEIFGVEK